MSGLRLQRDLVAQPSLSSARAAKQTASDIVERPAPTSVNGLDLSSVPDPEPAAALAHNLKRMKARERNLGVRSGLLSRRHPRLPFFIRSQIDSGVSRVSRVLFRALWVTACLAATSGVAAATENQTLCSSLSRVFSKAAENTTAAAESIKKMGTTADLMDKLGEGPHAAAKRLDAAREQAVGPTSTYAQALQDMAYELQKCAR